VYERLERSVGVSPAASVALGVASGAVDATESPVGAVAAVFGAQAASKTKIVNSEVHFIFIGWHYTACEFVTAAGV